MRFGSALEYHIDVSPALALKGKVPVYSLQLLAENTIKHNSLTTVSPLHISIIGDEDKRTVAVSNNLQPKSTMEQSDGVGLFNLSERYKLLGNYDINIIKTNAAFTVVIKVLEYENSNS